MEGFRRDAPHERLDDPAPETDPELEKKLFQGPAPLAVSLARRQELRRVVRESARQSGGLCSELGKDWFPLMQIYLRLCQEVHGVALTAEVRADWQEVVEGALDLIAIGAVLDDEIAAELSGLRAFPVRCWKTSWRDSRCWHAPYPSVCKGWLRSGSGGLAGFGEVRWRRSGWVGSSTKAKSGMHTDC